MTGIKRNVEAYNICFEDCIKCLQGNMEKTISWNRIRSIMHDMYIINVQELDLTSFDDKRYIIPNILARGHYGIVKK